MSELPLEFITYASAMVDFISNSLRVLRFRSAGLLLSRLKQAGLTRNLSAKAAILPAPYRKAFATIFDAAPVVSWEEVEKVCLLVPVPLNL